MDVPTCYGQLSTALRMYHTILNKTIPADAYPWADWYQGEIRGRVAWDIALVVPWVSLSSHLFSLIVELCDWVLDLLFKNRDYFKFNITVSKKVVSLYLAMGQLSVVIILSVFSGFTNCFWRRRFHSCNDPFLRSACVSLTNSYEQAILAGNWIYIDGGDIMYQERKYFQST